LFFFKKKEKKGFFSQSVLFLCFLILSFTLTPNRPAMPFVNTKIRFGGSFSFSILSQLKKYNLHENLKSNILDIFQSLKLRILMEKNLPIPLHINFTPNTLGGYGLN